MSLKNIFTLERMRDLYYGTGPHDFMKNGQVEASVAKDRRDLARRFVRPFDKSVLSLVEFAEEAGYELWPSSALSSVMTSWILSETPETLLVPGKNATQPWFKADTALRVNSTKAGYILNGAVDFVLDGAEAEGWLVFARDSAKKLMVFEVRKDDSGVQVESHLSVDPSYPLARLTLKKVKVGRERKVKAMDLKKFTSLETLLHSAAAAGAARRACDIVIEHSKTRHIGGGPIARFQTLAHRIVDMHIAVEKARSMVGYAAATFESGQDAGLVVSMAKTASEKALLKAAQDGIQIHGAEAFQWIHAMNFFFRRGLLLKTLFGQTAAHYDLVSTEALKPKVKKKGEAVVPLASFDK